MAIVNGEGFADRELASVLVDRIRRSGAETTFLETLPNEPDGTRGLVEELAASRAAAVVLVGLSARSTRYVLAALAPRLPAVPVLWAGGLAGERLPAGRRPREVMALRQVLPAAQQPRAGRRVLAAIARERGMPARPEALYGYEAMRLVLRAIDEAGPDRRAVVRAALGSEEHRTVLGRLTLDRRGDVRTRRLARVRLRGRARAGQSARP